MLDKKLLFELLKTPSPSGFELNIQKKVIEMMAPYDDKVITHHNYNVIHAINPNSKMKVLLCGHIDEIGLYVDKIMDNGLVKMGKIGGIRPYVYVGQHVRVIKKDGSYVYGVIGYVPNMSDGKLKVSDLSLDIGTSSKEETEKLISIGDPIIHTIDYQELSNNRLAGRALDDKLAVYILLETLKRVKEKGSKNGVYVATTVGEETTGRGAKAAADEVNPTLAIVVDVTYVSDVPYLENLSGDTGLGRGPALTIGSLMNDKIDSLMRKAAEKLNIKVQNSVDMASTWTDTDDVYYRHNGIPSYLVNIPLRYMHSSVEVCDLKDVEEIIEVLTEFIISLDENTSFNPFE